MLCLDSEHYFAKLCCKCANYRVHNRQSSILLQSLQHGNSSQTFYFLIENKKNSDKLIINRNIPKQKVLTKRLTLSCVSIAPLKICMIYDYLYSNINKSNIVCDTR